MIHEQGHVNRRRLVIVDSTPILTAEVASVEIIRVEVDTDATHVIGESPYQSALAGASASCNTDDGHRADLNVR